MGKSKRRNIDMLNGPLPKKILLFAIPLALTSILQQLLNSADASIAGRFLGGSALAGIGGVSPISAMFVNLFVGLSIGANVVVAMRIGNGQMQRVGAAVHTAMALAVIVGLALMACGLLLAEWILDAVAMPADSYGDGLLYLRLFFGTVPFMTVYNFASAILRAHGDSRRPLYALAVAAVLNIGLNFLFAGPLGWGVAGIGVATIIACAACAALAVAFIMREDEPYRFHPRQLRITGPELREILRIGIPAGIQGAVFSLSNTVVQAAINSFGSATIAGSAATLNFEYYTYFFVNAFAQTAVTFTSQNYAARNVERCRTVYRWCQLFGLASSLALGITFTALGRTALSIFTTDPVAWGFGMMRMWFIELLDWMTSLYDVPAGAMRGMGWSTLPAVVTIFGSCVLRIAFVAWVFPYTQTFVSLMALYPVTWLFMIVVMQVAYALVKRRAYRKIQMPTPATA